MAEHQERTYGLGTLCLHAGYEPDPSHGSRAVPIVATTSFVFRDTEHAANLFALKEPGFIYSRIMNPTCDAFERRMAALDGGVGALALSSGQSAIYVALLTILRAGQNFITATSLYGGTWTLFTQTLPKMGIKAKFFDPAKPESIGALVDSNTRCVYLETIGNPKNDVPDFEAIVAAAHARGLPVILDNTVATPVLLRSFEQGVDINVYSCTKFIGGHGLHIGGCIVDSGNFDWTAEAKRWPEFTEPDPSYHGVVFAETVGNACFVVKCRTHLLRDMGSCMSPFAAFLFLQGLETLHLRMERHCQNAQRVAEWLKKQKAVTWVNYPGLPEHPFHANARKYLKGFGAIMGFGIRGGRQAGVKFIDSVKLLSHLANIGDSKTLVIHPASTTHQQLTPDEQVQTGVTDDYIRLSIGTEDVDDIIADIEQALAASQA